MADTTNTGNWFTDLFSANNVASALSGATSLAASAAQMDAARKAAEAAQSTAGSLASQASQAAAFQPFTITSSPALGQLGVSATGDITMTPSQQQEAMTQQALTGAQSVLGGLLTGTDARTQDIYSRLQAARQPEIDRQQAQLQQQMAAQGRLGLGSSLYGGGSPEEFARQQALLEQQSKDYLTAMTGAQSEQTAQSNLLGTLTSQAYQPQSQMLAALQGVTPIQQALQSGRLAGAETIKASIDPVINAQMNAEKISGDIYQQYLKGLSGMLAPAAEAAGTQSVGQQIGSAVESGLQDLYNSIFGG